MAWIETIAVKNAAGELKTLYDQVKAPGGHVDNILKIHSLWPRTLRAHLEIYKASLHSKPNGLSYRERELVGVLVSMLNGCDYCVQHHRAGLARHLGDAGLAERLTEAAAGKVTAELLSERERALCAYAARLTLSPAQMQPADLETLRAAGLDDAAILDLNQVVAYFAYANRTVNGLGVQIAGEPLGLHPDEARDDFRHG